MLRELEEAVQRKFHVPPGVSDTTSVANGWESRLHISQVWNNIGSTLILLILKFFFFSNAYMNIIHLNRGERSEDVVDHRSYVHNLSSCEIEALSWLDSSVGRALHRYRRSSGHGFESHFQTRSDT